MRLEARDNCEFIRLRLGQESDDGEINIITYSCDFCVYFCCFCTFCTLLFAFFAVQQPFLLPVHTVHCLQLLPAAIYVHSCTELFC